VPQDPDTTAIIALIDEEVRAVSVGEMDEYDALLAPDAVFMPPNGATREGTELRKWLRAFVTGFAVEWLDFQHVRTEADGNLGYHAFSYEWRVTPRAGGEPTVGKGKGLHVVRRDVSGGWKIVREIWNATPTDV
jgi:ketosteroid isomerase-like protein